MFRSARMEVIDGLTRYVQNGQEGGWSAQALWQTNEAEHWQERRKDMGLPDVRGDEAEGGMRLILAIILAVFFLGCATTDLPSCDPANAPDGYVIMSEEDLNTVMQYMWFLEVELNGCYQKMLELERGEEGEY